MGKNTFSERERDEFFGKFCTAASRLSISGPLKERTDL
jgi:hypothetical protein